MYIIQYQKRDQFINSKKHNGESGKEKYSEPALCVECGNIFRQGRWLREIIHPEGKTYLTRCPACRRKIHIVRQGQVDLGFFDSFSTSFSNEFLNKIRKR